jgi:energy-coupling factor transporter ATP-binding protein EcfA2
MNPQQAKKEIQKKLFAFNAAETLAFAWNAGENVLLTGPGGYGKTDAAQAFFDLLKEEGEIQDERPFVLSFGQGMTEERLFSGIDLKRFQDEGELVYNLKSAFVNFEYVIFEELFDAFPGVLLILKDVLQSKTVRMGDKSFPLRTKFVVACTNRSNDEVATDRSTWALLERFVFQKEVTWSSWEASDYHSALKCAFGGDRDIFTHVAHIAAECSKGEEKISPRTCVKAAKAVLINGNNLAVLNDILGFNRDAIKSAEESIAEIKKIEQERQTLAATLDVVSKIVSEAETLRSGVKIAIAVAKLVHVQNCLGDSTNDANLELKKEIQNRIENNKTYLWNLAADNIQNAPEGSLAYKIKRTYLHEFDFNQIKL